MIKKIFGVLRKIIMGALILYGYNLMALPLNVMIPINVITISVVGLLGLPSLIGLIVLFLIAF